MRELNDLIENPRIGGSLALLRKIRGEGKIPTNEKLRNFRDEIESDIKYITGKIKTKIGYELPDGIKRT